MSLAGIGHNQGPTMEAGHAWRVQCWKAARRALTPTAMPIEVVRSRVRRAAELGLEYRTYAGIRASMGHDIVAILFSTNALRLIRGQGVPVERVGKLSTLQSCDRLGLAIRPISAVAALTALPQLDEAHPAPAFFASWSAQRASIRSACGGRPADRVLLIGETAAEAEWHPAGGLAGFVSGEAYFSAPKD